MRGGLKKSSALTNGRTCKNWLRREERLRGVIVYSANTRVQFGTQATATAATATLRMWTTTISLIAGRHEKGAATTAPKDRQRKKKTSKPTPLICCLKSFRLLAYQYNNACQKCLPYDSQFLNNNLSDMAGNKSMKTIV